MRENSCLIFRFNEKHCFMVLTEKLNISVLLEWANSVLAKKLCFVRKICCVVLPKKNLVTWFCRKFSFFCNFGRKQKFFVSAKKIIFAVWAENKIYSFCGKILFFLQFVKTHFCGFAEKTHYECSFYAFKIHF